MGHCSAHHNTEPKSELLWSSAEWISSFPHSYANLPHPTPTQIHTQTHMYLHGHTHREHTLRDMQTYRDTQIHTYIQTHRDLHRHRYPETTHIHIEIHIEIHSNAHSYTQRDTCTGHAHQLTQTHTYTWSVAFFGQLIPRSSICFASSPVPFAFLSHHMYMFAQSFQWESEKKQGLTLHIQSPSFNRKTLQSSICRGLGAPLGSLLYKDILTRKQ